MRVRTDILSKEERSKRMRLIRSRNTKPEIAVRKIVKKMGFNFRTHQPKLPGKPDLVFPSIQKVIFVHGCFWHRHDKCRRSQTPKSKKSFWLEKFSKNVERDARNKKNLKQIGWQSLIVWECEVVQEDKISKKINIFLCSTP